MKLGWATQKLHSRESVFDQLVRFLLELGCTNVEYG